MKFEDAVPEIKRRIDIATVVGRYVRLKKTGNSWTGLCPFHEERTASFNVRSDKGTYKCFGCGVSGDIFSFIELKTGQLFADIVRKLAGDLGIVLESAKDPHRQSVEEHQKRLFYAIECAQEFFKTALISQKGENQPLVYLLKKRGLSTNEIEEQGLGFGGDDDRGFIHFLESKKVKLEDAVAAGLIRKGHASYYSFFSRRVTVPICDHRGRIVAFAGRAFLEVDSNRPKYINSPSTLIYEKSKLLFGLHQSLPSLKKGLPAVLVEGYFDVLAIRKLEVPAVAPCGTSLTEDHVAMLGRYTKSVLLCFDQDVAGRTAQKKALLMLLRNGFHVKAVSLSGKDPDAIIRNGEGEKLKKSLMEAKDAVELACREVSQMSIFGMSERIAALESLLPFLAASPSQLVNRQYIRLASQILGEEESVLIKEVAKIAPQILEKRENHRIITNKKPIKNKQLEWTHLEKLLARALLSNPKLCLKIDSSIRQSINFELSDFIDRLSQLLNQSPEKDPTSLMHLIPIPRESEWVNMLLENARHGNIVTIAEGEQILEDLAARTERVQTLEALTLGHADLSQAQVTGDIQKMHSVLASQREKLKKLDKSVKSEKNEEVLERKSPCVKENEQESEFGVFDELRWT